MQQRKKTKNITPKKKRIRRVFLYLLLSLVVIGLIGLGITFKIVKSILDKTPPITDYNIEKLLEENSFLYDKDGNEIEKIQAGKVRTIVGYNHIDKNIIDAFIAIEDKTFFEHHGFNYIRLVGAVIESLKSGKDPSGTSTITQQYARNMYLPETKFEKSYIRKVQEAYYTVQIEKHMNKEQIMAAYLNTIDLGANVQGIEAACQRYFSKPSSEVDYIEAAILAGIPKASSEYAPFEIVNADKITDNMLVLGEDSSDLKIIFNENMISRFKTVIYAMHANDKIDNPQKEHALEYADSKKIVERFKPGKFVTQNISSYFVDMVKEDVIKTLMEEKNLTHEAAERQLYGGGLRIYSTLDTKLQKLIEHKYNADVFSDDFDNDTKRAVIAFQKKYSLGTDGVAGPNTLKKLIELNLLKSEDMTKKVYRYGMKDNEVLLLKQALEKDGLLFKRNDDLPTVQAYRDQDKNILGIIENKYEQPIGSKLLVSYYDNVVNENEEYVVKAADFKRSDNGDIILLKNKTFNFYPVTNPDGTKGIEAFIKDTYKSDSESERRIIGQRTYYAEKVSIQELYIFKGKTLFIPFEFKKFNDNGDLVISATFKEQHPDFYRIDENGNMLINKNFYSISKDGIIQPQSSMVLIDYHTGELRAIVGGRNVTGQKIYNRALNPRQPGSSIKPLGVYIPALDNGMTVATVFDDVPRYTTSGQRWPQNYFDSSAVKYKGIMTLREALHDSNNVVAVKIADKLGVEKVIPYLEKFGISTLITSGNVNDVNLSAVALGGMTKGTTTLDMTAAYGAIANSGVRNETITFTKILDKEGNILIDKAAKKTFVIDEKVAFLMESMMESGARLGLAKKAAIKSGNQGIPIAGKTGTTSSKNDAWFVGYTPYYVAGMWIGNDIQMPLSEGSSSAARFWQKIMKEIHEGLPDKAFKNPNDLGLIAMSVDNKSGKIPTALSHKDPQGNTIIREYFIPGTQPTEEDDVHVEVTMCSESGKLITPYCPERTHVTKVMRTRLDEDYDPYAHGNHYAIADDAYTIPKSFVTKTDDNVDFGTLTADSKSPYCFIHTGVVRDASTTAALLPGIKTLPFAINQLIIVDSLKITTIHGTIYNVDAGSRINGDGTIIAYDIKDPLTLYNSIYPWQIKSFEINPDGPLYTPPETEIESTSFNPFDIPPEMTTEPPLSNEVESE